MALPVATRSPGFRVTASVWNSDVVNNINAILNASGHLALSSAGAHAIGGTPNDRFSLYVAGTFSPNGAGGHDVGLYLAQTINAQPNAACSSLLIGGTIVEAGVGTHGVFSSATIVAPIVTAGAAALTNAFALFVSGVPTAATFNCGVYIDSVGHDGIQVALSDAIDVSHGITDAAPTSVYGCLSKANASAGGLAVRGLTTSVIGLDLKANVTSVDTTKSASSQGAVNINCSKKSGTALVQMGANENMLAVRSEGGGARFILDSDGDSHQDVGTAWTNFDDFDDIELLNGASAALAPVGDPLREQFSGWLEAKRHVLEDIRLVTFNQDGHHFANWSRFHMVEVGAIRQLARALHAIQQRLAALEGQHA